MQIKELPFQIAEVNVGSDQNPRSLGLHVSSIIRDLSNRVIHKGQRQPFASLSPEAQERAGTYQSLGFAWERVLERSLSDAFATGRCVRPGEQVLDGIYLTPDPVDLLDGVLEEWKCTWKSSRKAADLEGNFREWFWQIKSYLKVLGFTVCRLRVFFVNGDYKDSGPQVKCFELTFTQRELDENWHMLLKHAEAIRGPKV
jgi:hypothetical protein